jgi:membrane associated rhomboid family serine protease
MYAYMRYTDELAKKYRNFGPTRWLNDNFTCSMRNFREGRYWTLLTHTLMHGSLGHLAFNMFGLYSFGPLVVLRYGVPAYFALWVGAGLTGAVCELYFTKETPGVERFCVGASGSILGIVTANAFAAPKSVMMVFPIVSVFSWTPDTMVTNFIR